MSNKSKNPVGAPTKKAKDKRPHTSISMAKTSWAILDKHRGIIGRSTYMEQCLLTRHPK